MSSPFVYSPHQAQQPTPYLYPYYNQPNISPFIPSLNLPPSPIAPSTPYLPASQPTTPTTPNTRRVHFEDEFWARAAAQNAAQTRPRRPSWSGTVPMAPQSPFLQTPTSPFHNRRHSWGNSTQQQPIWSSFTPPQAPVSPFLYGPQQPQFLIHPLLNGEAFRPDFGLDLSCPTFRPLRYMGPGQTAVLGLAEMRETATYPAVTRMRITSDAIPQWPIELEYTPYDVHGEHLSLPSMDGTIPPITLGDVLFAIHRSLHTQISHLDWGRLTMSEEIAIARAYTRRCRSIPSVAQLEASQGVKRVDFLLDRFMFRGLVRAPGSEGFDEYKLIV